MLFNKCPFIENSRLLTWVFARSYEGENGVELSKTQLAEYLFVVFVLELSMASRICLT